MSPGRVAFYPGKLKRLRSSSLSGEGVEAFQAVTLQSPRGAVSYQCIRGGKMTGRAGLWW